MKTSSRPRGRRALSTMPILCLGYGVAMVVMTSLLTSQHEGPRFIGAAAAIAPLTAVAILYATLRDRHGLILAPRHKRLLLLALAGGIVLGVVLAGVVLAMG